MTARSNRALREIKSQAATARSSAGPAVDLTQKALPADLLSGLLRLHGRLRLSEAQLQRIEAAIAALKLGGDAPENV